MKNTISLILGGGRGTRLYPLTKHRSKPAVPLAGKYRLIDIPISNCLNSDLNRIYVLTQFLSVSLHRHISHTYKLDQFSQGFVEILAAQQTMESTDWYQGTADAVRHNLRYLQEDWIRYVLILSGDQVYRMDFRRMVDYHRDTGADMTIAVIPVSRAEAKACGIVRLNDQARVIDFLEKPQTDEALKRMETASDWIDGRGIPSRGRVHLASMGIYLFNREVLFELLQVQPPYEDFGKHLFPASYPKYRVQAFLFDGYWEDVGTVKAYHQASLALASPEPPFVFHSPDGVIYTRMRFLPPARINGATLTHCLVSEGSTVQPGAVLERCILGVRSHLGANVRLTDTVVIGADRYETPEELEHDRQTGVPCLGIGDGSVIENAIIDKDCRIGRNVRIVNQRRVQNEETEMYVVRDGIVCIPKATVVPDGTVI